MDRCIMKKQDSSALFGVIGLGRFGSALARTLAEAGKEVIEMCIRDRC